MKKLEAIYNHSFIAHAGMFRDIMKLHVTEGI